MDLSAVLDYLDSAPLEDAQRAVRLGTRIVEHRTEHQPLMPPMRTRGVIERPPKKDSIRAHAEAFLRPFKNPVDGDRIVAELVAAGHVAASGHRILRRLAAEGDVFFRTDDGKYGLVAWKAPGAVVDHDAASGVEG